MTLLLSSLLLTHSFADTSEGLKQNTSRGGEDALYGKRADEEIKRPAGAWKGG